MKYFFTILALLLISGHVSLAQEDEGPKKRSVVMPDIPGYKTLKADFHIHSVFSDGKVWPTFRIDEAIRDGLDVISLTEHMDFLKESDDLKQDRNRSFQIASAYAKGKNILVINGAEISPRVPPYHNNVLFLKDANLPFDFVKSAQKVYVMKDNANHDQLMAPFLAANKQGAFVVFNHPGNMPAWDVRDTAVLTSFNKELLDKKIMAGIEVVNSGGYNVRAHQLAIKHNLTMLCNTDEHLDTYHRFKDTHRPMTLVFATESSEAAIKEALIARRTALYFEDYLIARQTEAEAFFKAAVIAKTVRSLRKKEEPVLLVKLMNNSDMPFRVALRGGYAMEKYPLGQVELPAHKETTVMLRAMWQYPEQVQFQVDVTNILVSPSESLKTTMTIPVAK
ncbi:phosphotransferase [Flavihumibacter sp. R14]|nr:phosphotransferase [Flavihumibacter soli]